MLVSHTCNPSYLGGRDQEDCGSRASPGKYFQRPHLQNNQSKVDWSCGSSGRGLLCKLEGLSSNSNPTKKTNPI
jgi:hypothetical protein